MGARLRRTATNSRALAAARGRDVDVDVDPFERIRQLTQANRDAPDPRTEVELVRLRHEAFASLDRSPVPEFEPVTASGDGNAELAAVRPEDLSAEALRDGFARQGCLLVRNLVAPERVQRLVEGIDRSFAAFDAGLAGASLDETLPWYAPFKPTLGKYRTGGRQSWLRAGGTMWTADSPRMLFELIELVDELGVGAMVADYLKERPALSGNKCTLRRVPVDAELANWHQDGAFLGGAGARTVNFWLSLSHCGRDAPGMDIVPRRIDEVLPTGTEGAFFRWSASPDVVRQAAGDTPILRPEFGPGDALFFDHLFLHRTAAEPGMARERYAMETWFFAPSTYPDDQIPLAY